MPFRRRARYSVGVARLLRCGTALLLAIAGAATLHAEENRAGIAWLSGDAIRGTFSGQKVGGLYPNGRLWSEVIEPGGQTDYRENEKHWLGQWWATAREFCFSYPPPGLGGCFRVTRISVNCFELYDFSNDVAKANEPPHLADLWNGRMWLASQPTTCEERPSS